MEINETNLEELIKCGQDPKYFIKKYIKVRHPIKGLIKFEFFPFQEDCLDAFFNHKKIIINKSRQLGLSTLAASYSLWLALFHKERDIIIVTTKMDTAKFFIKKIRTELEELPDWLVMPTITAESVKYIQFSNGSQIKALTAHEASNHNNPESIVIIDEVAYVDNIDELWLRTIILGGGQSILISTPAYKNNIFHKIWGDSKKGKNGFHPIKLPWSVHPERGQEWFNAQHTAIGEQKARMELLCKFGRRPQ